MEKFLITGTSKGIGFEAKEYFSKNSYVIGISRTKQNDHENFRHYQIDLSEISQISNNLKLILNDHQDINNFILNAGFGIFKELDQFSEIEILNLLNVNLISNIIITKTILPYLRKNNNSRIFFIGSEASLIGQKKGSIYCASKFGLRGFVQSIQKELSKNNTQISLINPGMVKTEFYNDLEFCHGELKENYINSIDIIKYIELIINNGDFCLAEEINLKPHKKVILKK
ncbi:MAG: SDR family NAD(P)-dependent oxidoreductase [Rickettsiales bacterium]|nr:SDR family NAD(P)-dependent oxidoreductase [Rickettsiales bacterium]